MIMDIVMDLNNVIFDQSMSLAYEIVSKERTLVVLHLETHQTLYFDTYEPSLHISHLNLYDLY